MANRGGWGGGGGGGGGKVAWGQGNQRGGSTTGGGGYRGGNQYEALNQRGGGGGGTQWGSAAGKSSSAAATEKPVDVRATVLHDMKDELPVWLFSCYAHAKEGKNDLVGDVSPEEARWVYLQGAAQGQAPQQYAMDYQKAKTLKQKELETIRRMVNQNQKLPSQGGASIREPNPWVEAITGKATVFGTAAAKGFGAQAVPSAGFQTMPVDQPQAPAFGFGATQPAPTSQQPATLFGQPVPAAAPAQPFGQPAAIFGQPAAGFGQPAAFGATQPTGVGQPAGGAPFGQPAPAAGFGQPAPAAGFGQPAQPQGATLFGQAVPTAAAQPAQAAPAGGKLAWGAGTKQPATAASPFGFGAAPSPAPATGGLLFGATLGGAAASPFPSSPFPGAGSTASPFLPMSPLAVTSGSTTAQGQDTGSVNGTTSASTLPPEVVEAFRAPSFKRGQIPDTPPPPELCT